jgi:ribulose kinase
MKLFTLNHRGPMITDTSKKSFVFVIQIEVTAYTTARIMTLFMERGIEIDELHFYAGERNQGRLMIHCRMERDRIGRTAVLLDKFPGILKLDWMESKRRL